jgi:two-component system, chemotaxis family, CheB/CheR fusion protein
MRLPRTTSRTIDERCSSWGPSFRRRGRSEPEGGRKPLPSIGTSAGGVHALFNQSQLRASREEYEGANEELRAANEELQSVNEEYRSTAEELETSKEELQSVNEDPQTVNSELKIKLESVSRAHSDVQNLMAATDVGILFLDPQLRINRFTPRISELFNIVTGDEGRSITDFTDRLDYDDLAADARKVLRDLTATERELHGKDGGWYLTRLKPYRTVENKIDGVVVTFVDIGERRRAEDSLRESEARMRILVGELQHRTRNLISVVMAMVDRTAVSGQTVDEFRASFGDRLLALARVHGLLSRAVPGDRVTFDSLLQSELSAQSENGGTVSLDGPPDVVLRSNSVQALAMALHELTTNAVKYGALGQKSGRLHIRWRVQAENGSPWISVDWKESDVETPQRSREPRGAGNGRRLIEDALSYQFGARTTFAIEQDGVHCTIAPPLSGPQTEEVQDGQLAAS